MQEKQFDLAVFMDTQKKLILPHLRQYRKAQESPDVGRTVIRWTVNMLKCRNIHLTYQGESVEARVVNSCPQGGVLSFLQWCMVVDSLFLKLNA